MLFQKLLTHISNVRFNWKLLCEFTLLLFGAKNIWGQPLVEWNMKMWKVSSHFKSNGLEWVEDHTDIMLFSRKMLSLNISYAWWPTPFVMTFFTMFFTISMLMQKSFSCKKVNISYILWKFMVFTFSRVTHFSGFSLWYERAKQHFVDSVLSNFSIFTKPSTFSLLFKNSLKVEVSALKRLHSGCASSKKKICFHSRVPQFKSFLHLPPSSAVI